MRTPTRARKGLFAPSALLVSAALLLTACGSGDPAADAAGAAGGPDAIPTTDVVSRIGENADAVRLLPPGTKELILAVSVGGNPPGNAYLPDGKTLTGQDVDFAHAVGNALGISLKTEQASFEAVLPALDSGKYDIGASNFGVTEERRRTIDFVTYINDGQGFAAREDSELSEVTDLKQLCGLKVATGAGTTFEATLEESRHLCTDAGDEAYSVQTYSEPGALWSSLQQGRSDIVMSTINGLRYAVAHQQGLKFLNEFHRLDVGFALKKGSKLVPALQAAVNGLIADGTYARILKKWDTTESAIEKSEISPPELKD
ncbi:ABC transporter substrate-binding protein [Streptomyces olivaceus]|uniref:ABC transporter substrate-binding protein n=1 Tax=Streptomyces olivaceus TaxID=47716 RepID=UPI0022EF7621|nr:ABC transporter substrate-binding protein [Streptomyces olivaceus]GHI96532.1 ABC transporter substrate-binding protein [Streptomyces olivaceus]